jgi:hypothetical protein
VARAGRGVAFPPLGPVKSPVSGLVMRQIIPVVQHTDKKENQIFLICKEIQMGSVAKSYMRKAFLVFEEMRKYLTIYEKPLVIYDFDPF